MEEIPLPPNSKWLTLGYSTFPYSLLLFQLTIPQGVWLILSTSITISLKTIRIEGTLEIRSGTSDNPQTYDISFSQLLIYGGYLVAGSSLDDPFTNANLKMTLVGSPGDPDAFSGIGGPEIGPKAIGNFKRTS